MCRCENIQNCYWFHTHIFAHNCTFKEYNTKSDLISAWPCNRGIVENPVDAEDFVAVYISQDQDIGFKRSEKYHNKKVRIVLSNLYVTSYKKKKQR